MSNPETPGDYDLGDLVELEISYPEIRDRAKEKGFLVLEDEREEVQSMMIVIEDGKILPVRVEIGPDLKPRTVSYSNRLALFTEKLLND